MKLYTRNYAGNLHQAAVAINKESMARYVIAMDFATSMTVVVFMVPTTMFNKLWHDDRRIGDPDEH